MASETVADFEASLGRLDVGWTRTDPGGFDDALREVLVEPAVGTPLPFEDVALDAAPITLNPTPEQLRGAKTGVTAAAFAIADYGSLVLESTPEGGEQVSLFPDTHVAVVRESDVVADMDAAFERLGPRLREGRSPGANRSAVLATGPSATADMGALVRGAHGPKDVHVLLLGDGGIDDGERGDDAADGGVGDE
ncbi:LutC/YkgG family protein [Halegenticoccus tardaugens]|uniref:LutC/YkgG family protein n=1 Tax=Halegenticoccus tardaugens TaxID=2071624 RepID=UPI00100A9552|nr:LUD domain-containing protein [Halegenticoccus tardaugens]